MIRSRIFAKLLLSFLLVIGVATLLLDFLVRRSWEQSLRTELTQQLIQETQLFADRVQSDHGVSLDLLVAEEAKAAGARATVIDTAGAVLADSGPGKDKMEDYATRPEFQQALKGKVASSTSLSQTLGTEFLYVAVPISGGAVRLAYPRPNIAASTEEIRRKAFSAYAISALLAMLLAAVFSQVVARRLRRMVAFAERVAEGDFAARMEDSSSDEIAQLAAALDRTARELQQGFAALESSRSQLETLLNGIQDAVLALSSEKRVIWYNGALAKLLGRVRRDLPLLDVVQDPEVLRAVDESLALAEVRSSRASGVVPGRVFGVTVAPMPKGGAVCALHDLTEIERVEKTRRDFIANVSHELRTPLTSIQGYTETLLDATKPDDLGRGFLEIIRKNANRMARLTDDLLTLARVESGEQKMEFHAVPADALVRDAFQSFQELSAKQGLELVLGGATSKPVLADREAIHQVFSNLLENASRYAASGKKAELGAREIDGAVEFYVRDFGAGIGSEHLLRLFERFYRVDKARSNETGGTGLGLAIVKHIVLNHGGMVKVESELNRGSTFSFRLPQATVAEPAIEELTTQHR